MKGYSFTELAKLVEAAMPRAGGAFSGNVSAPRFIGPLQGNADTATAAGRADRLSTARSLTIGSTTKAFDGTGNLSWSLAEIGAINESATVAAAHKWATPRALQIGNSSKAVDGTSNVAWSLAEIGAIARNTPNVLGNPGHGVGFLASGTAGAPWIAAYFGDAAATGGRVVIGTLGDGGPAYATIGAHSPELNSWSKLAINPAGAAGSEVYIGMSPNASSGSGNLFVGNDIEANYVRIRSPIPNDNRYVVNKGYVDGKFAPIAHRENWADKDIHTQTSFGIAWRNYGNGHVVCDASSGNIEGIAVPRTDAQTSWDNVTGATLVGWNGQTTFGVRVDRARLADSANWSAQSDRATYLNGVVATAGQDITIHGKRAVVGVGDANQLVLNYENDWGSTQIVGHTLMQTVESNRHVVVHNGATAYVNAGLEVRSTDGSDVRIGMHRLGNSAASIVHTSWGIIFEREENGSRSNVAAARFFADAAQDASLNALTRKDYVDGRLGEVKLFQSRGEPGNLNNAGSNGVYRWAPGAANIPVGNTYGHAFTFSDNGFFGDGAWASQLAHAHGNGLYYRTIVNGGFSNWSKFMFEGGRYTVEHLTFAASLELGTSAIWGPNSAKFLRDHGNGNTTISAGRNSAGGVGELYLGYNNPSDYHYTSNIRLCSPLINNSNNVTIIGTGGDLYDSGHRVYSPANKPIPADIGAVSKAGDTMTGTLKVAQSGSQFGPSADGSLGASPIVSLMNSFIEVVTPNNASSNPASGIVFHNRGVSTSALYYQNENASQGYFNFKSDEDSYDVRVNNSKIYHQGFKPTPADIGAATAGHSQWRLVTSGDVNVAMANHATGSLRATIDTGINSAHGFVHDAAKYRAVIYTNNIETSNPGACSWGAYGTLRALARWNGPHTIQLDIYSFGTNMTKGQIYRWEVYEVI